jgi:serine/threonine-protein kinase
VALAVFALGAALTFPTVAGATTPTAATAEALFQQGRTLMAEKRYAEACPKLEESQRLDPALGTLLLTAACHEAIGRVATAWAEFEDAAALAKQQGRRDREQFARKRAAALKPRLPFLTIEVPDAVARTDGLSVERAGELLSPAAWGVKLPIDPGSYAVIVRAPGHRDSTLSVSIPGEGADVRVAVEPLEREPTPVAVTPPLQPVASPVVAAAEAKASGWSARTTAGVVVGGAGLAVLAGGLYFGSRALSGAEDVRRLCPDRACPNAEAAAAYDEAKRDATFANVAIPVGILATGVGAYLIVTRGKSTRVAIAPAAGGRSVGVVASGIFQ